MTHIQGRITTKFYSHQSVIFLLVLLFNDRIQRAEGYVIGAALMNYQTDLRNILTI